MACGAFGRFDPAKYPIHRKVRMRLGFLAAVLFLVGCAAAPVCPTDRPITPQEEEELLRRLSMEELARCLVAREPERFLKGPAKPYRGKVVDAETGAPIAGAVVIAVWEREFTHAAGRLHEFYDAQEVLTDQAGDFLLDPSEIESRAPFNTLHPMFRIYKPGYGFYPRYQVSPTIIPRDAFRQEMTVVSLRKARTVEERTRNLSVVTHAPDEKQPNLLKAISVERVGLGLSP